MPARLVKEWIDWRGPEIGWLFCPIHQGEAINRSLVGDRLNMTRRAGSMPFPDFVVPLR